MYDIITVGEILVEVMTQEINQSLAEPGVLLGPYPSGAPAIAIDQAAKMGAKTAIIGKVGHDDFGRLNIERLKKDGVDISYIIQTKNNTTGVAFVTYFSDGNRQFVFHFTNAACGDLSPADLDLCKASEFLTNTRYLHIMGCSITGSPSLGQSVVKAVEIAVAAGVKISFDPNIRPELLSGHVLEQYKKVMDACDVLLTGKSEIRNLYKLEPEKAAESLLSQKDRIIIIKDGSRGTSVFTRAQNFSMPAYSTVEVDPTGAGDSFDGTFLAVLCAGGDLKQAADYANAAGALAVSKRGPMEGNATKAEIETFILHKNK